MRLPEKIDDRDCSNRPLRSPNMPHAESRLLRLIPPIHALRRALIKAGQGMERHQSSIIFIYLAAIFMIK